MGTPPAPPVCVRVVLPDDTVLRVAVAGVATASDLVRHIQTHCRATIHGPDKSQRPEALADVTRDALTWELELVRSGLVFQDKQLLEDMGLCDGDILELRTLNDPSVVSEVQLDPQHSDPNQEPETGSSDEEMSGELPMASIHVTSDPRRDAPKEAKLRAQRRRHPVGRGILPRASFKSPLPLLLTQQHHRLRASSTRHDDALSRLLPRDFLLRVGFDCLDRLTSLQSLSRQLLMQVRDIYSRLGPQPIATLFPVVHALASQTSELLRSDADGLSDTPSLSVRWLYPLISRSVQGTELPVVIQGYVDVAEWVALWRNQRRVYACLCDGAKLLFFANQKLCEEFLFELAMRGNETTALEPAEEQDHKRFLKESAPHTTIDLLASKWNVRKGEITSGEAGKGGAPRHAFALFDTQGKLRLIMDVASQREADQWIAAIKTEIRQSKLLESAVSHTHTALASLPSNRIQVSNLTVPLRWLHSHVDSLSRGLARVERVKSWNLTQALKDLRRDRLQINGIVYGGLCVEEIVGALLMEITRLAPTLTPADAMQFTRLLLVTSSRTQGGGDILDAMRLAVGPSPVDSPEQYCFCPVESTQIAPIRIEISQGKSSKDRARSAEVVANIRMEMRYRVFTSMEINNHIEHSDPLLPATPQDMSSELQLTGVYHRQLLCSGEHWNRLDGTVAITVEEA